MCFPTVWLGTWVFVWVCLPQSRRTIESQVANANEHRKSKTKNWAERNGGSVRSLPINIIIINVVYITIIKLLLSVRGLFHFSLSPFFSLFLFAVRFLHFSNGFLSFRYIYTYIYCSCRCRCRYISSFFCFDERKKAHSFCVVVSVSFWTTLLLCQMSQCERLESVIFHSYFASNKIPMWTKKEPMYAVHP